MDIMKPIRKDVRAAIIEAFLKGRSNSQIVKDLKTSKVTHFLVWYTIKRFKETGDIEDCSKSG